MADSPPGRHVVLICGGRQFDDHRLLERTLSGMPRPTLVIHGNARGADRMGGIWAKARRIPVQVYDADWKNEGYAAGPKRNQRMIDEGKPDLVIAFPGGRGTADMVRRAKLAGVPVIEVQASYDKNTGENI